MFSTPRHTTIVLTDVVLSVVYIFQYSIFRELDDELQESLYDYLEVRGIDDKLAEFLHRYMGIKDKNEYVRWMENLISFIQKK